MSLDDICQRRMDVLEAMADAWAEEIKLTGVITNVTSPMGLSPGTPRDVQQAFHERMKSIIFNLAQQAFIEGAVKGVELVNAEIVQRARQQRRLFRRQTRGCRESGPRGGRK